MKATHYKDIKESMLLTRNCDPRIRSRRHWNQIQVQKLSHFQLNMVGGRRKDCQTVKDVKLCSAKGVPSILKH